MDILQDILRKPKNMFAAAHLLDLIHRCVRMGDQRIRVVRIRREFRITEAGRHIEITAVNRQIDLQCIYVKVYHVSDFRFRLVAAKHEIEFITADTRDVPPRIRIF